MTIKDLNAADIPMAAEILYNSWHKAFAPYLSADIVETITLDLCVQNLKKSMDEPSSNLKHVGFFKGATLVGTLSMGASRFRSEETVEIWSMHVRTDEQRSGIGSELLRWALGTAKSAGYQGLHLTCITENTQALNFYQKHGGVIQKEPITRRGFQELELKWDF